MAPLLLKHGALMETPDVYARLYLLRVDDGKMVEASVWLHQPILWGDVVSLVCIRKRFSPNGLRSKHGVRRASERFGDCAHCIIA